MASPDTESPVFSGKISVEQFATDTKRTVRTINRWAALGLPIIKRGNLRLIDVEKARAWFEAGERGGLESPSRRHRGRGA